MTETVDLSRSSDPLLDKAWEDIRALGLESHVAELDARGYTIIQPDLACPNGLADRLLEACLQVAERRNGIRPDLAADVPYAPANSERFKGVLGSEDGDSPIGDLMQSMLFEDPAFEAALMNPALLAVATYMCGYRSVLFTMGCFMKGPNKTALALHADTPGPSPLPAHAVECNLTYALTDFTEQNGATAFVPGSHKWCRQPQGEETKVQGNARAVAVECPAGSLICWHGNTWHGAFNRTTPGLRVSVPVVIARSHIRTQENLIDQIPQEMLDRNSPRFAVLTQQSIPLGWANQDQAISGTERASKYAAAYIEELGIDPQQTPHSLFA